MSATVRQPAKATRPRARRRVLRWVAYAALPVFAVVGVWFGVVIARQSRIDLPATAPSGDRAALVARGAYVARAADCVACHTSDKAKPYAGGVPFVTPFGTMYSTNITQDTTHGIGAFTDAEIIGAVRNGISRGGKRLYPSMPYTSYTGISDTDMTALVAYLRTIKPVDRSPPANAMGFPFNQRWAMAFWNVLNFREGRQQPDPSRDADWNRGVYLVQSLAHCQECHTPRNVLQGLSGPALSGAALGTWDAYNITSSVNSGIGGWSEVEIASYLKTGVAHGKANAGGPMAEVVENSTQYLEPADIAAMARYLRSVPAADGTGARGSRYAGGTAYADIDHVRALGRSYDPGSDLMDGALLFNANCATCHAYTGKGVGEYPRLIGNTVLGDGRGYNLVNVILHGVQRDTRQEDVYMPAFDQLSDTQVAKLANFLTRQFGDRPTQLTAEEVHEAR